MKSLLQLQQVVLQNMGDWCRTSTIRDQKTIAKRYKHEGVAFLAIALPKFAKDFERGLEHSKVDLTLFAGFQRRGELPVFLGGFLDLVFDRYTGLILDTPSVVAIRAIRQICLLNGKVLIPCTKAREHSAMKGYVEVDGEVKDSDARRGTAEIAAFRRMSLLLWGNVFEDVELDVQEGRMLPRHGPGATADRLKGNQKFDNAEWTERLETVFPYWEFLFPNWRASDSHRHIDVLRPEAERPVKVTPVSKSLDKPRIIAIEPTCVQFMQQGVSRSIRGAVRRHNEAAQFIDTLDQTPNQRMAKSGSLVGDLATLDLSEASDRVSNSLVKDLVIYWPQVSKALQVTRSLKADVPGFGRLTLSKYASMGSALCFPIEMLVFLTIVFLGIQAESIRPLTRKSIDSLAGKVRVFGDDIIVPVQHVRSVIEHLEAFGLKVNSNKSFWTGKFRESCGKDYYDGTDVSVVRCRNLIPSSRSRENNSALLSTIAMRNQFFTAGAHRVVDYLDKRITRLIPFPFVLETSPVLGRLGYEGFDSQRQSGTLHSPLVRGYVVSSKVPESNLDGPGALLKCLSKQGEEPFADKRHLERGGRPLAVDIKLTWASPF